ncbi:hypothetical protein C7212DRAFT_284219 [Tuber magnatum]|uniref:F-box domain-containing protein n=1 Tax=Tuber magnatum TaxID=42249 RepID=A0A317SGW3_9PEZI|nr:hypothetical protein C7212DRAFT_284219 [Tuber magnatum]
MADPVNSASTVTAYPVASSSLFACFHGGDVDGRLDTDEDLEFIEEGEQEDEEDSKPSVFNQGSDGKDKEGEKISPGQDSRKNGDGENKENEKERNTSNGKIRDLENSDRGASQGKGTQILPETNSKPATKRAPLTLVELPVDVLKEIVKEVNHTNDLTNLSLTCRCLHALSIPHIYSRFDIVWPDASTPGDRTGVDALTYGLATLTASGRRGNDYARWVKKFSLGNGPGDWVGEYNINKEGGKMLGTLVCLAITRMIALETFSWDMPTGVLRDVFKALHDLNGTLKNVHVRFHDNTETTPPTSQDPSRRVETPTFKGFEGLRSLSVLDIDEMQYLEEVSYAVEKSVDRLRELRLGLAHHVPPGGRWIRDLDEVPHGEASPLVQSAVGGALGIVVGRIVDLEEGRRRRKINKLAENANAHPGQNISSPPALPQPPGSAPALVTLVNGVPAPANTSLQGNSGPNLIPTDDAPATPVDEASTTAPSLDGFAAEPVLSNEPPTTPTPTVAPSAPKPRPMKPIGIEEERPVVQLTLETLELERVPLSIRVLTRAIDWTTLSNLTILGCHDHDRFWRALRHRFSPHPNHGSSMTPTNLGIGKPGYLRRPSNPTGYAPEYRIRLKKLHTDTVTGALLAFIRETLPPNSLEVLFLQEGPSYSSVVPMELIYKSAIRRHKGSLKKLLIDSNVGGENASKWIFDKEVLAFISTGKMPNLRELGMAIEWKNWHYFLTRLPFMQQLRSLYIHYVRGGPHISDYESKEMAQQIVNTVILRPEVELCYVGVLNKCYELLEDGGPDDPEAGPDIHPAAAQHAPPGATGVPGSPPVGMTVVPIAINSEDEDSDAEEDEEDDEEDEADGDETDTDEAVGDKYLSDDEDWAGKSTDKGVGVRLREILFYDDKVAVFRARHGKL